MTEHTETPSCPPDQSEEPASVITVTDSAKDSKDAAQESPPQESPAPLTPEQVEARFAAMGVKWANVADGAHERIKGVITRRLQKVQCALRSELSQALVSKDRPLFGAVFDRLVEEAYLIPAADPNHYRLAVDEKGITT